MGGFMDGLWAYDGSTPSPGDGEDEVHEKYKSLSNDSYSKRERVGLHGLSYSRPNTQRCALFDHIAIRQGPDGSSYYEIEEAWPQELIEGEAALITIADSAAFGRGSIDMIPFPPPLEATPLCDSEISGLGRRQRIGCLGRRYIIE